MTRRLRWFIVTAAIITTAAVTLEASGPRVIRAEGTLLSRPVVLSDWKENADFWGGLMVLNGPPAPPQDFTGRAYVELSVFHASSELNAYLDAGKPAADLRADQASQHARFYLAVGDKPAWLVFSATDRGPEANSARRVGLVRWVPQEGLDYLEKHGIPIREAVK